MHVEISSTKVSIDTVQSEMKRRRPESPQGPRPPCRHAPERVLDQTETSRRRVWYVASYAQYEATCPTRRLEFSQGSRIRRDPKIAPCQREPLSAFYSYAPFSTSKPTRTTKRKIRYRVASFCFKICGTETLGVFSCVNFDHKNHPKRTSATVIRLEPQGLVCTQTNGPQVKFWGSAQHTTPL